MSSQHKAQHRVQKHGKHCGGALATRALVTRVCCAMADPETKKSMRRSTRTSKRKSATRSQSVKDGARGTQERALTSSENKTTFETRCEIDEYFHSSINAEMLTIAVHTHADSRRRTSMEIGYVRELDASHQCGKARFMNVVTDWR